LIAVSGYLFVSLKDEILHKSANKEYDIIIVGGGLVGATLALALAPHRRVAVLEVQARPLPEDNHPSGERAIVLSSASKNILTALGIWSVLQPYVEAVKEVQVSDRGHFGKVRMTAAEEDLPALGYVIQAKYLQVQLAIVLEQRENIKVFYQAQCLSLRSDDSSATVIFNSGAEQKEISAELVVGADGQNSVMRELLSIAVTSVDYQQSAVVSNIDLARSHGNIAYERFTSTGPLALLPLAENQATLIWTLPKAEVENIRSLNSEQFTAKVQEAFGYRLGRFLSSTPPVAFPIMMHRAVELVRNRVVFVGNAANAIHPIAGQGLNLGLRDVAVLAELIAGQGLDQLDNLLREYVARRRTDHLQIINITHSLVGFFSNAFLPLTFARNAGMTAMDLMPPVKRWLSKRSLGHLGHITPLACGVSISHENE
jgi:2-octaprenyl-6-methoxyphenol hydroxylase